MLAWLVTIAELVGGAVLLIGLPTRLATLPVNASLIGATVLVEADVGIIAPPDAGTAGAELDIALLAGLVALFLLGPGRISLDHAVGIDQNEVDSRDPAVTGR